MGWLLCISTVTSPRCILQQNVNYSRSACKCKAGQQEKKLIREQEGTWGGVEAVLLTEAVLLSRWFQRRSSFFLFLSVFSFLPSSAASLSSSFCSVFFFCFSRLSTLFLSFNPSPSPSLFFFFWFPSPVFIGQKQGKVEWWGGHCWPPLHYLFKRWQVGWCGRRLIA